MVIYKTNNTAVLRTNRMYTGYLFKKNKIYNNIYFNNCFTQTHLPYHIYTVQCHEGVTTSQHQYQESQNLKGKDIIIDYIYIRDLVA